MKNSIYFTFDLIRRRLITTSSSSSSRVIRTNFSTAAAASERISQDVHVQAFDPETASLESAIELIESASPHQLSKHHFSTLLRRCSADATTSPARASRLHTQLHLKGFSKNRYLCNLLIHLYTRSNSFHLALSVFENIRHRNLHTWTTMLAAYARYGHFHSTVTFLRTMLSEGVTPDEAGISIFLTACTDAGSVSHGRWVRELIRGSDVESEFIVQTAMVSMYGKLGYPSEAESVFLTMTLIDCVAWSAMIAAYARNGRPVDALRLFREMDLCGVPPNSVTFVSGIDACASLAALRAGCLMHDRVVASGMVDTNVVIGTALVHLYGKCGEVRTAVDVFRGMREKNVITWSALSAVFAQNGHGKEAVRVLHRMDQEGVTPNSTTFVSVLDGCGITAALRQGRRIHSRIEQLGEEVRSDVFVLTALVNMYSKCGSLALAGDLFERMLDKTGIDLVLWNTLIGMNAQHGEVETSLHLFGRMIQEGLTPTVMTLTSLLFTCSHSGMLQHGRQHFLSFISDHGVRPDAEHFGCLIDLLGRAGFVHQAQELLVTMPYEPHIAAWMSFLGACRTYKNLELAQWASERVFVLDPRKRAPYVLMSNMYARAGKWSEVVRMRKLMEAEKVLKEKGISWVEVGDRVHEFVSGDTRHPRIGEIHDQLEMLTRKMKGMGYVPDTEMVLHDVKREVKEEMVGWHSEKLAVAFALMVDGERGGEKRSPVYVVKNLRVCGDCHTVMKLLSEITGREIVVRDNNRFHRFAGGACSCSDYW